MRVFKTREFSRFAHRERIRDGDLCEAVERAELGLVDADLGGGVIKQRVARPGQGRSGGFRTVIAFRSGQRSIFMFGFAKSRKANLSGPELVQYRALADFFLLANEATIKKMIDEDELSEIDCDGQDD